MEQFNTFLDVFPKKVVEPGEMVLHQGDKTPVAFIIRSGLIKAYDINKEGEIKIISYDSRYEAFPIAWIFSKSPYAMYYHEAFSKTELSLVPKKEYLSFLHSNAEIAFQVLNMYVDRYLDFSRRVNSLSQLKAEDKILYALDFMSRRFGDQHTQLSKVKILIPLSQQEIANFVGLTRETVSTVMNSLKRKKIIKYKGIHGLEINIKKVEELTSI